MKKNVIIWILSAISIVSVTALITILISLHGCDPRYMDHEMHPNKNNNRHGGGQGLMSAINMNPAQTDQFVNIRGNHHARVMPVLDEIRKLRQEFFNLLHQDQVDSVKLNAQILLIADAEVKLQKESARFLLELKTILDPVQQDSLFQFMSRHMDPKINGMCEGNPGNREPKDHCGKHQKPSCETN